MTRAVSCAVDSGSAAFVDVFVFVVALFAGVTVVAGCQKPAPPPPPTPPSTVPAPAPFGLSLPYEPHTPGAQVIEHHGRGCAPDFENCGVVFGGAAGDVERVDFSCVSPPAPLALPAIAPTVQRWRGALERREGPLVPDDGAVEVARVDVDEDGRVDRVVAVRADVAENDDNADGPGACGGVFVDFGDAVVAVADDVCDGVPRVDAFNQVFRLRGAPGVFLHLRHVERGANGGALFHVVGRTFTRLPLRCAGNG